MDTTRRRKISTHLRGQVSLRFILGVVTAASLASMALSIGYETDRRERHAEQCVLALGGTIERTVRHCFPLLPGAERCSAVTLSQCDLRGEDLSFLRDMPHLQALYASGSHLQNADMRLIAGVSSLEILNIGGGEVTDDGLASLATCRRLRKLSCSKTHINGTAFSSLASLPALEEVNADWCALDDDALSWLGQLNVLKTVTVSGSLITDRGMIALCRARKLEDVTVVANVTEKGVNAVLSLPHLRHATISGSSQNDGVWERGDDGVVRKRRRS